ncbi:MAG: cofactor-independent phosphoglycerate mutase [Candidatus Auribacter fodinae]|uniref:Cofactor-independent phosphoglycerate mutase n=1 Tax=Candidatus Auribacter fodinae TaxID=2093366 RepID=A0A3A4R6A7_9BACT|nr:MAG: cofactor-independent phosphoglycerate mutase [Candidatus Auribacter fodinae]
MKYVVCIGDGMADYPLDELGGVTPLQCARTPNMDALAQSGRCGTARMIPRGFSAGSDIAHLSIFGYEPKKNLCGRAVLEMASTGLSLREGQVAFRCDFVTESDGILIDNRAGGLSSEEASELIRYLNDKLDIPGVMFYALEGYKNIMVLDTTALGSDFNQIKYVPPCEIVGQKVDPNLPGGSGSDILRNILKTASEILRSHEINVVKIDLGENPANFLWIWGAGKSPDFKRFSDLYGKRSCIVSATHVVRGLGRLLGMDVFNVPGMTGYFDTNYEGKALCALEALREYDCAIVHVEAPDEASHSGSVTEKIKSIENFDEKVIGTIYNHINAFDSEGWRIMVISDHVTPVSLRRHVSDPVPFLIAGNAIKPDTVAEFNEVSAKKGGFKLRDGHTLMSMLLAHTNSK